MLYIYNYLLSKKEVNVSIRVYNYIDIVHIHGPNTEFSEFSRFKIS